MRRNVSPGKQAAAELIADQWEGKHRVLLGKPGSAPSLNSWGRENQDQKRQNVNSHQVPQGLGKEGVPLKLSVKGYPVVSTVPPGMD